MVPPSYLTSTPNGIMTWERSNGVYRVRRISSSTTTSKIYPVANTWDAWNDAYYKTSSTATTSYPTSDEIWAWWGRDWESRHPYPWPHEEQERRRAQLAQAQGQGFVRAASAEQRAQWQREEQERQRNYEEKQRELDEAKKRADELLKAHLTPQQREEFEQHNQFHLLVGDRKYRIRRGRARNIQLINEQGTVVKTLCAHPGEMVPDGDCLLAQKLMLESNEQEFLRIANHS